MARRMELPRVLGHEACGVVDSVGPEVSSLRVGDFVSLESHVFCGKCRFCMLGKAHLCTDTIYPGINFDGGFAEYVTVPAKICWINPPGFTCACRRDDGAIWHIGACKYGGIRCVREICISKWLWPDRADECRYSTCIRGDKIIACDLNPLRLQTAKKMGADRIVNAQEENLFSIVADMTDGFGVDVAIEYSGSKLVLMLVSEPLSKGGDFRLVGAPPLAIPVDFTQWLLKCPAMQNIHGRKIWDSWQYAVELLSNKK